MQRRHIDHRNCEPWATYDKMGQIRQQLGVAGITINDLEGFFMNKNELINKVADKTGIAKKDTEAIVNEA